MLFTRLNEIKRPSGWALMTSLMVDNISPTIWVRWWVLSSKLLFTKLKALAKDLLFLWLIVLYSLQRFRPRAPPRCRKMTVSDVWTITRNSSSLCGSLGLRYTLWFKYIRRAWSSSCINRKQLLIRRYWSDSHKKIAPYWNQILMRLRIIYAFTHKITYCSKFTLLNDQCLHKQMFYFVFWVILKILWQLEWWNMTK